MDVARLNFSHGTQAEHARAIRRVREAARRERRAVAILADLAGPKIRIGELPAGTRWRKGQTVVLSARRKPCTPGAFGTTYPGLARDVRRGQPILLDDGRIRLEVVRVRGDEVHCKVREGGEVLAQKGINLPGTPLSAPALTAKDRGDLRFAVAAGADLVALSFVRTEADVREASRLLRRAAGLGPPAAGTTTRPPFAGAAPPLIAKLEKPQALDDLDGILGQAASVMVARGDLGVEIPPERVPMAQKRIIEAARKLGRPVITATQMLESMTERSRPTRAEASDVANAVLDGTDAVMLSAETAIGDFPVEAVEAMDLIIREMERSGPGREERRMERMSGGPVTVEDAIALGTHAVARMLRTPLIVTLTKGGFTARRVAATRPTVPILAVTTEPVTYRQLALVWGIVPVLVDRVPGYDAMLGVVRDLILRRGYAAAGDRIVMTAGVPWEVSGSTNLIKVEVV
jgi:pyruvate kinase